MRQEDAGSECLFGNFLQLSAVRSRLHRRKTFAVLRRVALAGTMRVRPWRSNEPPTLCQITRKQLCQIIRKVTIFGVSLQIIWRDSWCEKLQSTSIVFWRYSLVGAR
jgi:hypothetical protein